MSMIIQTAVPTPDAGEVHLTGTQIGTSDSGPTGTANILQMAQLFDAPDWVPIFLTVGANATTAPDSTTTAYSVTETAPQGSQVHRLHQSVAKAASSVQYTGSIYAKQSARTRIIVQLTDSAYCWTPGFGNSIGGVNGAYAVFDIAGGQIGVAAATFGLGFSSASAAITSAANGFYRCALTVTSSTVTTITMEVQPDSGSGTGALSNTYSGTSLAFYVWGAQLEAASAASTYQAVTANGNGLTNLMDGDLTTWWEGPATQAWAGIDVGSLVNANFTRYRFATRPGLVVLEPSTQYDFESLVNGALIQTSNDPAFGSGVTTQDTIPGQPPFYPRYWLNERTFSLPINARAIRFQSITGAFGSLAELQFFAKYDRRLQCKPVKPIVTPNGGFFPSGATPCAITSLTTNAKIYYTTDGSTPSPSNGTLYTGPFTYTGFGSNTNLKAIAYDNTLSTPTSDVQSVFYHNYGFKPRDDRYDDRNILIEAHSGGDVKITNNRYYWFGTSMNKVSTSPDVVNGYFSGNQGRLPRIDTGIMLYSSADLYNWYFEGNILSEPVNAGQPWLSLTRPHVIYCAANNTWVLWCHAANFIDGTDRAAVATAPTPTGPWTWSNTNLNPDTLGFKDNSLFLDPNDGNGYVIFTVGTQNGIRISRLNSTFTNTDGSNATTLACTNREAPQLFFRSGTYFLITSQGNFYDSTSTFNMLYITTTASNPLSGWSAAPDAGTALFASDPVGGNYNAQPGFTLVPYGKTQPFIGMDYWIPGNLYASRQVWLPLTFADSTHVQASTPATWDLTNLS